MVLWLAPSAPGRRPWRPSLTSTVGVSVASATRSATNGRSERRYPVDRPRVTKVAGLGIDTGLPQSGLRLFFADTLHCAGLVPSDREGVRVVWTEDDVELRALPEGIEHFPCGRVALRVETSVPAIGDPRLPEDDVADEDFAAFHDVRDEFSDRGGHQLLGCSRARRSARQR